MQTFADGRDAKEFLVSRIVAEAQREGIELSDVERKMLFFSETYWAPPDFMEVNEEFERDYNSGEYENKMAALIRGFRVNARENDPDELASWKEAARVLSKEDHYLLVLMGVADGRLTAAGSVPKDPGWKWMLKYVMIGLTIFAVILAACLLYVYFANSR